MGGNMNKSILMSIKPQYVAKILNGEKTIEVRKKFPKDYARWVYIYCTKGKPNIQQYLSLAGVGVIAEPIKPNYINGKVVARFWCDKVEEIFLEEDGYMLPYQDVCSKRKLVTATLSNNELCTESCLKNEELDNYLKTNNGYSIHITRLEIFDKPKELKEFYKVGAWKVFEEQFDSSYLKREQQEIMEELEQTITKAPQSYMFVEGE